jgi:hypothetical protein
MIPIMWIKVTVNTNLKLELGYDNLNIYIYWNIYNWNYILTLLNQNDNENIRWFKGFVQLYIHNINSYSKEHIELDKNTSLTSNLDTNQHITCLDKY